MMRRALPLPFLATLLLLASACATTGAAPAEADILQLVSDQTEAWNRQDAVAWSKDFAPDAAFINIVGTVFEGRDEIQERHAGIFATIFKGSQSQVTVRKVQFIQEDLAIVDTTHEVTGHPGLPPPRRPGHRARPAAHADAVRDEARERAVANHGRPEHGREAQAPGGRAPDALMLSGWWNPRAGRRAPDGTAAPARRSQPPPWSRC